MIAGWMLHLALLSLLLAAAARTAEGALRLYRRPVRWAWLSALWLPLLLPPAGWIWRRLPRGVDAVAAAPPPPGSGTVLPALELLTPAPAASPVLDWMLGGAWALLVVVAAGVVLTGHRRLGRRARGWVPHRIRETEVWLSRGFGPAVVGFLRPRIVVPRWLLDLPGAELDATLLHESEHRRAGDTRLLLAGLAGAVLTPWNPVAWWAFRRLREAVETDCDRRVLERGVRRSDYGQALLAVGRRGSDTFLAAAALSEPPSFLERRLRMITGHDPRGRLVRAAGLSLVTGALLVVACEAPMPTAPVAPPSAAEGDVIAEEPASGDGEAGIVGAGRVGELVEAGEVELWLDGERSTAEALEELEPGDILRIEIVRRPDEAIEAGEARQVIRIVTRAGADGVSGGAPPSAEARAGARARFRAEEEGGGGEAPAGGEYRLREIPADGPAFTPYTVAPEMTNRWEVLEAVREHYPPLLRDAGIGGRAVVWFRISDRGEVVDVRLAESSGRNPLDEAALDVARTARFRPAMNGDRRVGVWIQIPVTFEP